MGSERLILSFLGTGNYQEVLYTLDGETYHTPFTQEALVRHYPQHRLLVFLTEQARKTNAPRLQERLEGLGREVDWVLIPDGRTEEDHWVMFNRMAEAIPKEASLVVDVTYGFRSQPILALAVLQFLEVLEGVRTERLVYGAIRDGNLGEFLDLTSFVELLRWTQATRELMRYGWGKPLAGLLTHLQDQHWKKLPGKTAFEDGRTPVTKLKPLGNTLGQLTLALELLRVREAMEQAGALLKRVEGVRQELGLLPALEPLRHLLAAVEDRYRPLAVEDPFSPRGLKAQAAMVDLLLASGGLAQAAALMRELVVTKVCLDRGLDPEEERSVAESYLGTYAQRSKKGLADEKASLGRLWNDLADLRNDVAHAGMRPIPTPAKTLEGKLESLWLEVKKALGLDGA